MAVTADSGVKVRLEKLSLDTDQGILESERQKWGLTLKEVYRLSLTFYKDKEGKALHLSYEDKLKLIAYTQQASQGAFNDKTAPPLGVLDMIGKDRRSAWLELGSMSQTQAMVGFIHMLDRLCPLFTPYVEANRKDSDEKNNKKQKEEAECKQYEELQRHAEMEQRKVQQQRATEEEHVRRIKDALNEQTYEQFLQYARQQLPGNPDQQAILVRQLQDQHYHQYVQQLAINRQAAIDQKVAAGNHINDNRNENELSEKQTSTDDRNTVISEKGNNEFSLEKHENEPNDESSQDQAEDSQSEEGEDGFPSMGSASMWTRGGATQFKQSIRSANGSGGVLQVGHGETLTVRVPTHDGGRCLFWEFATDNFDIGFGVYFEWAKSLTNQVTIHVAESDEEADIENFDFEDDEVGGDDLESGSGMEGGSPSAISMLKPPTSIVIPIYRRDSHLEVYAGSHTYPGEGVYLLKFDNTFSLWRSKTLYYRVYYTR